jgi:hypothetical protein
MSSAGSVNFITRTQISYTTMLATNDPNVRISLIGRMNLTDLKPVPYVKANGQVRDVAWSPDGSSVAYLMESELGHQLWLKTGDGSQRSLTPVIPLFGRGGFLDDELLVRFSPDGKYVLMVDTFVATSPEQVYFRVHSVQDGSLVWAAPAALNPTGKAQFATMAAWLRQSARLLYRDPVGVQTWDPPSTNRAIYPGLKWYSPSISPDDRLAAYAVGLDAQPHVEVRELATKSFRMIPGVRGAPFFVAANMLFMAEYAVNPQPGPGSQAYSQTGRAFVFDLRTNVETPVPFMTPLDFWPR